MSGILLFVCGEGGHYAQMKRLVSLLDIDGLQASFVVMSDSDSCILENADPVVVPPMTIKTKTRFRSNFVPALRSIAWTIRATINLTKGAQTRVMVSTGPGIAIVPALIFRLVGGFVVHVETWSRFSTKSLTGRVMHVLANRFYVQNEEQLTEYSRSIYAGRL